MTRMSREFTLVLLGAGLLTAGYLAYPEPDIDKNAETAAAKRVGGDGTTRRSGGGMLVFIHSSGGGYSDGYGQREMFTATCDSCGGQARVPFRPTGSKPVYCSECFSTRR